MEETRQRLLCGNAGCRVCRTSLPQARAADQRLRTSLRGNDGQHSATASAGCRERAREPRSDQAEAAQSSAVRRQTPAPPAVCFTPVVTATLLRGSTAR